MVADVLVHVLERAFDATEDVLKLRLQRAVASPARDRLLEEQRVRSHPLHRPRRGAARGMCSAPLPTRDLLDLGIGRLGELGEHLRQRWNSSPVEGVHLAPRMRVWKALAITSARSSSLRPPPSVRVLVSSSPRVLISPSEARARHGRPRASRGASSACTLQKSRPCCRGSNTSRSGTQKRETTKRRSASPRLRRRSRR